MGSSDRGLLLDEGHRAPVFFLTNRFNALGVLSSGFIGPRSWFAKYYKDLLEHAPGQIVLFRTGVSPSVIDAVLEEGENVFPVLLEIDPGQLSSKHLPALSSTAEESHQPVGAEGYDVWAGSGCIPFASV